MFTIGVDPVLSVVGPFTIRWFGLFSALAVVVGLLLAARGVSRRGPQPDLVYSAALWVVPVGLIGARLLHVADRWPYYASDPLAIVLLQEGGWSVFGALLLGTAAAVLWARKRAALGLLADSAAVPLLVALALGRVGNIINGDASGAPTDLPWGLAYTHANSLAPILGTPAHPYPVVELIWDLLVVVTLWRGSSRFSVPGARFLVAALLYALGRLVLGALRAEPVVVFGLQQAQVLAILVLFLSAVLLWRGRNKRQAVVVPHGRPPASVASEFG